MAFVLIRWSLWMEKEIIVNDSFFSTMIMNCLIWTTHPRYIYLSQTATRCWNIFSMRNETHEKRYRRRRKYSGKSAVWSSLFSGTHTFHLDMVPKCDRFRTKPGTAMRSERTRYWILKIWIWMRIFCVRWIITRSLTFITYFPNRNCSRRKKKLEMLFTQLQLLFIYSSSSSSSSYIYLSRFL